MLKARNIFITLILSYLALFLVCTILELVTISSTANDVTTMVRTAADMALEQVQATDDFFTTGGGYIMSGSGLDTSHNAYRVLAPTSAGTFEVLDLFPAFTGQTSVDAIFQSIYSPSDFQAFLSANPSVLDIGFIGGTFEVSPPVSIGDVELPLSTSRVKWFYIPTVAQLGDTITGGVAKSNVRDLASAGGRALASADDVIELWKSYDLDDAAGQITVNGATVDYYLTPLSLGVTYLSEDLLQALFMNNMDLLMRSKYVGDGYNLNDEDSGNGVLKTNLYANLVDDVTLDPLNPINNGVFTLLRGNRRSTGGAAGASSACFYDGVAPKIEYVVLDMYDTSAEATEVFQQVFGPRYSNTSGNARFSGRTVSGSLFKEMNQATINNYKTITGTSSPSILDHKPFVVAKVTFYVDVIIPYTTTLLREMRGRLGDASGSMTSRTLFNPFSGSSLTIGSLTALAGNYVDVDTSIPAGVGGLDFSRILNGSGVSTLRSGSVPGSMVMSYTTYFAVSP